MKLVQLKSGRDAQYHTGVEELQKSSTNRNVKVYFLFEYISEICAI